MAFTCGFFNSVNHDRKYDAVQHGMIFDGIITDGIYATYLKAMVVKASANPSEVIVQPGRAWFNHTWSYNDADYPVAAPDPEVVLDRIDTLVLDVNNEDAVRNCQFLWVQGTPTSQVPEPPELIHTATHNQYPLCDVYRQAGTTQIYAADITNRVGTSDCPFVTGVLEGINIDDLLAQWDDEFHTWENATKASFEGWMINQQAVYSAWWDALKTQMAGDVADVEEWVQTIKDIIDEETATHLQLEIDEINSMLPSGSHIIVTTADTELYSRAVTITDEDNNTLTSQFDATGVAVFKSVPYVGNLTIEATDGIRTATAVVNTPYFARYEFPLAFWSATVNITGGTELGGETVTITDSSQILVGTVVLNASGTGVFNATYPDTYKFSVTHGGQTMEVSLAVTQETTYNVEIHSGFNWAAWCTAAGIDPTLYDDLDELLADEVAVRRLFTKHASVDVLAGVQNQSADVEKVINNDLCAKWINLSAYALDTLYANTIIAGYMDTADLYFYGELAIMPQVPTMTSNTAPSGVASASSEYGANQAPWKAFDGDDTTAYFSAATDTIANFYLGYDFASKVSVREIICKYTTTGDGGVYNGYAIEIVGSNDKTTWTRIADAALEGSAPVASKTLVSTSHEAYKYYRLRLTSGDAPHVQGQHALMIYGLQFYAYAPKGNVPVMTANSAPYGEASATSVYSSSDAYQAYRAFRGKWDGTGGNGNCWQSEASQTTNQRIVYKSTNPICVKAFDIMNTSSATESPKTVKLQGSNDGTNWHDISGVITCDTTASKRTRYTVENDDYYLYIGLMCLTNNGGSVICINTLQFYGRELSVSVPTMTSNTAPYGEASASAVYSDRVAYKAFDGSLSDVGWDAPTVNNYVAYTFTNPVCVKRVDVMPAGASTGSRIRAFEIRGSNDNFSTYETLYTDEIPNEIGSPTIHSYTFNNNKSFKAYSLYISSSWEDGGSSSANAGAKYLQFFGKDYSEKEFETGTTKKWLYDHGVELTQILLSKGSSASSAPTKESSEIVCINGSTENNNNYSKVYVQEDVTPYSLLRMKDGGRITKEEIVVSTTNAYPNNGNYDGGAGIVANASSNDVSAIGPNNYSLDISNVNQSVYLFIGPNWNATRIMTITEWWLE